MVPARLGSDDARLRAFGEALRALRDDVELSQEGLASAAGLDRTYVGGLERGERNPTLKVVWALAEALGVSAVELLRRAEGDSYPRARPIEQRRHCFATSRMLPPTTLRSCRCR